MYPYALYIITLITLYMISSAVEASLRLKQRTPHHLQHLSPYQHHIHNPNNPHHHHQQQHLLQEGLVNNPYNPNKPSSDKPFESPGHDSIGSDSPNNTGYKQQQQQQQEQASSRNPGLNMHPHNNYPGAHASKPNSSSSSSHSSSVPPTSSSPLGPSGQQYTSPGVTPGNESNYHHHHHQTHQNRELKAQYNERALPRDRATGPMGRSRLRAITPGLEFNHQPQNFQDSNNDTNDLVSQAHEKSVVQARPNDPNDPVIQARDRSLARARLRANSRMASLRGSPTKSPTKSAKSPTKISESPQISSPERRAERTGHTHSPHHTHNYGAIYTAGSSSSSPAKRAGKANYQSFAKVYMKRTVKGGYSASPVQLGRMFLSGDPKALATSLSTYQS